MQVVTVNVRRGYEFDREQGGVLWEGLEGGKGVGNDVSRFQSQKKKD